MPASRGKGKGMGMGMGRREGRERKRIRKGERCGSTLMIKGEEKG